MQEHFTEMEQTQELLCMARTGLWVIEIDEGREPRMYGDKAMLELLGLEHMPQPEECYRVWYDGIDSNYYSIVSSAVDRISQNERAEVQYPWEHPQWGRIFVRCGGVRDLAYDKGLRIRGYHQNITDTIMLKDKALLRDNVLSNLCQCYYSIYMFDLDNDTEEAIWQENEIERTKAFPKGSLKVYYEKFVRIHVCPEDQEKMRRAGSPAFLRATLSRENPVYDIDFRRSYPDGFRWIRSRFSVADMEHGRVTKVVFANMNIHEQKLNELKQEEENRQALLSAYEAAKSANEAKSNFLSQMSHDIRTPMNAIIGMTSIAMTQLQHPDKLEDCLNKINVSSSHLLTLIDEVLDMSRIEKGKLELAKSPFCLDQMLKEVETIIRTGAEEKSLTFVMDTQGLVHCSVIGDEGRLRQVLLNLLSNSVKYTPPGGYLKLTVKEITERSPGYGNYAFIVDDNGIGMTEEFLEHIFVPFMRENDSSIQTKGTGLGMSISQGIVSAMQGNIQVESKKNVGSRFTVSLSLELDEKGPTEKELYDASMAVRALRERNKKHPIRLLVAEDNALNMEIVRAILEDAGFLIEEAVNGQEALTAFNKSQEGYYQAVLMDLQMPVMDGYQAARKIRESGHPQAGRIPIIALTANAFAEDMAKALAAGMDDHVAKPIDYDRLFFVLDKYIL